MKHFYDVHVFYDVGNSYSVFFESSKELDDDEAILKALELNLITNGCCKQVDYVEEISQKDYLSYMK